jgi:hypothetical protein
MVTVPGGDLSIIWERHVRLPVREPTPTHPHATENKTSESRVQCAQEASETLDKYHTALPPALYLRVKRLTCAL